MHMCVHTHVSTHGRLLACKGQGVTEGSHPQCLPRDAGPCFLPFHGMEEER